MHRNNLSYVVDNGNGRPESRTNNVPTNGNLNGVEHNFNRLQITNNHPSSDTNEHELALLRLYKAHKLNQSYPADSNNYQSAVNKNLNAAESAEKIDNFYAKA